MPGKELPNVAILQTEYSGTLGFPPYKIIARRTNDGKRFLRFYAKINFVAKGVANQSIGELAPHVFAADCFIEGAMTKIFSAGFVLEYKCPLF